MDEHIITQVEKQVSTKISVKLEAQQVSTHIKSLDYAIIVDVFLTTSFVGAIVIVVTSHEEGNNGHTQTITEVQHQEQL